MQNTKIHSTETKSKHEKEHKQTKLYINKYVPITYCQCHVYFLSCSFTTDGF